MNYFMLLELGMNMNGLTETLLWLSTLKILKKTKKSNFDKLTAAIQ